MEVDDIKEHKLSDIKKNIHEDSKEKINSKFHRFAKGKLEKVQIEPKVTFYIPTPVY